MIYAGVFAHPDDEMTCLGTLLRLYDRGHRVSFITITPGDKGLPFDEPGQHRSATEIRAAEMRRVAARFNADYYCLSGEDGFTHDSDQLRAELINTLRRAAPDVVFTHWTSDYNPDHVATAKLVTDACLFTTLGPFAPGEPPLASVPRIIHVDPGVGYGFEATHFVELDEDLAAAKSRIIRLHESQMGVMRHLAGEDYADQRARMDRLTGARLLCYAAEAFRPSLAERRIPWPTDLPGQLDCPPRNQV